MENEVAEVRIDNLDKEVEKLNEKYDKISVEQATLTQKMNCALVALEEVKESVKAIQLLPSKRWDTLIGALISSVVAAFVGFLFGKYF